MAITETFYSSPSPWYFWSPDRPGPHPLICITPILGRLSFLEDLFFEKRFARFFAKQGFAIALIDRPIFEFVSGKGLEQIQAYLMESLRRNAAVLEVAMARPEVDAEKVATFGVSFGAVINSLWAARDRRFKAHVFALGGGNLPEIFMQSRDPLMRSYFKAALQDQHYNKSALRTCLNEIFLIDPLKECKGCDLESKALLVLALFDRVVPIRYGMALRKAIGKPETIYLPLGHYLSILSIPFLNRKALSFFRRKLHGEN